MSDEEPSPRLQARLRRLGEVRRLVQMVRPYRWRLYAASFFLLVGSGLGLVYPQVIRIAVDRVAAALQDTHNQDALRALDLIGAGVVGVALLQVAAIWTRHYLMSWLGERVVADLRRAVFQKLLQLPPAWYHSRRSGEIVGRLSADVTKVEGVIGSELSMALRNGVTLIGGVTLLLIQSPQLTVVMLFIVPPLILATFLFGRFIRRLSRFVQDRLAHANAHLEEVVGGIETVQAFVREPQERATFESNVESTFTAGLRLARWRASFMATSTFFGFIGLGAIVWMGGRQVVAGAMSAGELIAFLLYTMAVAGSVATIAGLWGSLQRAAGATERLFELIDTQPDIADPEAPAPLPSGGGAVTFQHVHFAYPGRPDRPVLEDIELSIAPGEVLALVGESGAGKSTLASLVLRFHDPSAGAVHLDGMDLRQLRLAELRQMVATVAQEPLLFSGSVGDNIAYGKTGATREEVVAAAKDAQAHAFICSFPDGYATQVGERGVQLSVGQKQRVAIARAILANPRVLILDEATSNLDATSEAAVQQALSRLMQERTTVVIAHRLSTVREADRIVALQQGRIVEQGTHESLMRERGIYHRLVSHQVIRDVDPAA